MNVPMPSRTKELQAISRQKIKMAVQLITGHTAPIVHMFKLGLSQRQDSRLCGEENVLHILNVTVRNWHAEDAEFGSYVLGAQGSRKHEGKWPDKPDSQYQAWHNTLTPF